MARCLKCMKEFEEQYGVCPYCGQVPGREEYEAYQLRPGTLLRGRYLIGTSVGMGGFGITYGAWDQKLDKKIAVKEYYPSANGIVNRVPGQPQVIVYSGSRAEAFEVGKERFLTEARNMAKFNTHPTIVHVFDFFEENGTAYITMEFLEGISYKDFIAANGGKVNLSIAREVTLAVLDALKEVHKSGIIHRDISPDNVFICDGGIIKLIDFGAARFSSGEVETVFTTMLKPGYAPPEQYRKKSRQGPWTDIYAVGAMYYRAVTGKKPEESMDRLKQDNVLPPNQLNPEIPEKLSNLIMRAMALNSELRFQNVDQFREALQEKTNVRGVKEELKHRRTFRVALLAAVFGILLTAGGICFSVFQNKRSQAILADATLVVWYPIEEEAQDNTWQSEKLTAPNGESIEGAQEFMEKVRGFNDAYPNIEFVVTPIPAGEYENRLKEALESGENVPDVFDSSCIGTEYYEYLASLENVYSWLEDAEAMDSYYYLDEYRRMDHKKRQIPLSFQVPVIYGNSLIQKQEISKGDVDKLQDTLWNSSYSVSEVTLPFWRKLLPELEENGGYDAFLVNITSKRQESGDEFDAQQEKQQALNGKVGYYLSDTSEYKKIQKDMAGIYEITLLEDMPLIGRYTDLWSVYDKSSPANKKAGIRLVYFLLSKESEMKISQGLPLHKDAYEEYKIMNTDFSGIDSCLPQLKFEMPE